MTKHNLLVARFAVCGLMAILSFGSPIRARALGQLSDVTLQQSGPEQTAIVLNLDVDSVRWAVLIDKDGNLVVELLGVVKGSFVEAPPPVGGIRIKSIETLSNGPVTRLVVEHGGTEYDASLLGSVLTITFENPETTFENPATMAEGNEARQSTPQLTPSSLQQQATEAAPAEPPSKSSPQEISEERTPTPIRASARESRPSEVSQPEADTEAARPRPTTGSEAQARAIGTPAGGNLSEVAATLVIPIAASPGWSLETTSTSEPVAAGDVVNYVFRLANTGNVSIFNVSLNEPKCDEGARLVGGDDGDNVLQPGEAWVYGCGHMVTQQEVDEGSVRSTALSGGTPAGGSLEGAASLFVTPIAQSPSWSLTTTSTSEPVAAGDVVTYLFELTNTGNVTIADVALRDPHCESAATLEGGDNGDGLLTPGEIWAYGCAHVVTQREVDSGVLEATAVVSGSSRGGALREVSSTLSIAIAPIPSWTLEAVSTSAPVASGDVVDYRLVLINTGNVTVKAVTVNSPQCVIAGTGLDGGGDRPLAPGDIWEFDCSHLVTQEEVDAGSVRKATRATGVPARGLLSDAADTLVIPITPQPSWSLDKSSTSTPSKAGDIVEFTFVLSNTGNVSIRSVKLTDPHCDASPELNSDGDGRGTLEPGEIWVYGCGHTVTQAEVDAGAVQFDESTVEVSVSSE